MHTYVNSSNYLHKCANTLFYMILKYKKYWYNDDTEESVELPDDTVFIYVEGDVGKRLVNGYNHYLAATKSKVNLDDSIQFEVYDEFPGITFIVFSNIIVESEIPIISGEEFYKKFELDSYYIFRSTREKFRTNYDPETKIITPYEITPSKPMSVTKILSIGGPYRINIITAHIGSWLGDKEFLAINTEEFIDLYSLTNDSHWKVAIKQNCEEEFIEYINKTLKLVNYKVVSDQPSRPGENRSVIVSSS